LAPNRLVQYRPPDRVLWRAGGAIALLDEPTTPIAVRSGTPSTSSTVGAVCRASHSRPSRTPPSAAAPSTGG